MPKRDPTPSEKHNQLARDFVTRVAAETTTVPELMVVIESAALAAMLVARRVYGVHPAAAAEMVEMAIQQAAVRFSEMEKY